MKFKILILTFLLSITQPLIPRIHEISSMAELTPYLTPTDGLLVVFDIDSTILKLDNEATSVPWFCNELELLQKTTLKPRETVYKNLLNKHTPKLDAEYTQELRTAPITLAENVTGEIITTLYNKNIPFLLETKRAFKHIDITHTQLNAVCVHNKAMQAWQNKSYRLTQGLAEPAYYDDGILFTGLRNNKGDALKVLLKKLDYKPQRLIAIDDQQDNLVAFEAMARTMGIEFIGLRYGFLDAFTGKSAPHVFDPLNCGVAA